MHSNNSSTPKTFNTGNDVPFKYSEYFRSADLSGYKLCKQQNLDPQFHLKRCGCKICLTESKEFTKCNCECCDLKKELTLFFFYGMMDVWTEQYQVHLNKSWKRVSSKL